MQHNDSFNDSTFSFVNNIITPEGGTHLAGFRNALTKTFNSYAREAKILKDSDAALTGDEKGNFAEIEPVTGAKDNLKWIGIAPFAKHMGKIYPIELQEQVVAHFATDPKVKVFLFGGGKSEQEVFDGWVAKYPTVVSMIGKLNMRTELNLMSHLDVMLSMDSANMHLASLVNIPVISVWGATHPYAGFMGWKQLPVNTVQLDLSCRPCSVYGQKPCWRGDYACLREIKPEQVIAKIEGIIN